MLSSLTTLVNMGAGVVFCLLAGLSLHKHIFDMNIFYILKCVGGGGGGSEGPPPENF